MKITDENLKNKYEKILEFIPKKTKNILMICQNDDYLTLFQDKKNILKNITDYTTGNNNVCDLILSEEFNLTESFNVILIDFQLSNERVDRTISILNKLNSFIDKTGIICCSYKNGTIDNMDSSCVISQIDRESFQNVLVSTKLRIVSVYETINDENSENNIHFILGKDNNERDEFSSEVRKIAAERVAYKCCFKGCKNITIGPKLGSQDESLNVGVACHISAASKNGPRYDKNLTKEERMSLKNCIWMCTQHSIVIDKDEKYYSTEKLKQWKYDKEKEVSDALLNKTFYSYNSLEEQDIIYDNLLTNGSYDILEEYLNNYNYSLGEDYDELVLRYKVFLHIYYRDSKLHDLLDQYVSHDYSNIDSIAIRLLATLNIQAIKQVFEKIHDVELKEICNSYIHEKPYEVITKNKKINDLTKKKSINLFKQIMNHIILFENNIPYLCDAEGNIIEFAKDDYYNNLLSIVLDIKKNISDLSHKDTKENLNNLYLDFKEYKATIKYLSIKYQEKIYSIILEYLRLFNIKEYTKLLNELDNDLKKLPHIVNVMLFHRFNTKDHTLNIDEVLENEKKLKDFSLTYLLLANMEKEKALHYLDEHLFLLRQDVRFLKLYCIFNNDSTKALNKIVEFDNDNIYNESFLFKCLCCKYGYKKEEYLSWLYNNQMQIDQYNFHLYIELLLDNSNFDKVVEILDKVYINDELRFDVLSKMQFGLKESNKFDKYLIDQYNEMINKGKEIKRIHYSLAHLFLKNQSYQKAKEEAMLEYDNNPTITNLLFVLQLKVQTKDFIMDKYFNEALMYNEEMLYQAIIEIYRYNGSTDEALKYSIKGIMVNSDEEFYYSRVMLLASSESVERIEKVIKNCAVVLKEEDSEKKQTIIFPNSDIITNINPKKSQHYIIGDLETKFYSHMLFKKVGDKIECNDIKYEVIEILSLETYFCRLSFTKIAEIGNAQIIYGDVETGKEKLKEIIKDNNVQRNNLINDYNAMPVKMPTTIFARKLFSEDLIRTYQFLLFGNEHPMINNMRFHLGKNKYKYIVSGDSLYVLYFLNISEKINNFSDLYITSNLKNKIIFDIQVKINDILSTNSKGSMICEDDKLFFLEDTDEQKNLRHKFLVEFKDFINNFNVLAEVTTMDSNDIINVLNSQKCEYESNIFKSYDNDYIILTDDSFLYNCSNVLNYKSCGIITILGKLYTELDSLINSISKLSEIKFNNYFSINLYYDLKNKISDVITIEMILDRIYSKVVDKDKFILLLQRLISDLYKLDLISLDDKGLIDFVKNRM